jgi:hypothetical protein
MVSRRKILSRSRDDLTSDDEPTLHKNGNLTQFFPVPRMVSRRKILSRSRDDLTFDDEPTFHKKFEEDTFYSQEKLYKVGS